MSRTLLLALVWLGCVLSAAAAAGQPAAGGPEANRAPIGPDEPAGFTGSSAHRLLRRSGREVVAERELDLDGDGRPDALVVARGPDGLDVSAYWNRGERRFDLLSRSAALPADELASFEPIALGSRRGFLLDAIEDNPDEAEHHLVVFSVNSGGLAQALVTRFEQAHPEADAGRAAEELIDLGGHALGIEVLPAAEPAAWPLVTLRHRPKSIRFEADPARPVRVVLGTSLKVFRADAGRYQLTHERFDEYLTPVRPARVESRPGTEPGAAGRAADGDPASVFRMTLPGAELELGLGGPVVVRALRLVLGCEGAGDPRRLVLVLGDQEPIGLDRDRPDSGGPALAGFGDFDLNGSTQTLVFFRAPARVDRIRVRIESVQPVGAEACLVEVTALGARVDGPAVPLTEPGAVLR